MNLLLYLLSLRRGSSLLYIAFRVTNIKISKILSARKFVFHHY